MRVRRLKRRPDIPAVDLDRGAGEVACAVAAEEGDDVGELAGIAEAADGDVLDGLVEVLLRGDPLLF